MRRSSILFIHDAWRSRFVRLGDAVKPLGFRIFETYRDDEEQLRVFNLGTSKARPGESPHNWGLAVDFVPYAEEPTPDGKQGWHWPKADCPCWDELRRLSAQFGLSNEIEWDRPHVEVPHWKSYKDERWRQRMRRMAH